MTSPLEMRRNRVFVKNPVSMVGFFVNKMRMFVVPAFAGDCLKKFLPEGRTTNIMNIAHVL